MVFAAIVWFWLYISCPFLLNESHVYMPTDIKIQASSNQVRRIGLDVVSQFHEDRSFRDVCVLLIFFYLFLSLIFLLSSSFSIPFQVSMSFVSIRLTIFAYQHGLPAVYMWCNSNEMEQWVLTFKPHVNFGWISVTNIFLLC